MSRRRRLFAVVAALLAMQLVVLAAWRWKARAGDDASSFAPGEAVSRPAPALRLERPDGTATDLAAVAAGRPVLVHFWATWCPPCREELPQLIAFGRRNPDVAVVLVTLDESWRPVHAFLDGEGDGRVFRATTADVQAWGTTELPETWLVTPGQQVVRRWSGARAWGVDAAAATVRRALAP